MASRTAELIAKLTDQVSGPAKGMAGALKGTVSALDALKAKAGQLDAFKRASKDLDDASQKFKLAQQNVRKIKADMEAAGDGGKKLATSLRSAERQAEAAKNAFKNQGQQVRAMRAALTEAGVPLNQLADYERQLRTEIERTTAAMKRQSQVAEHGRRLHGAGLGRGLTDAAEAERLNRRMLRGGAGGGGGAGSVGGALAGAGVAKFGLAAAGIGGAAYVVGDQVRKAAQSSMSFERSLIEVGKATDTQGGELDAYGEKLMKLARQTGKTKEELASMLSQAGFAGRPKEELMDFTEYSAKAMVAWQTSAEDTGQALAEIGNIYGANQKRIEEIGDAINSMADNSASRESDLLEFMRRAGASSKEAGISAEKMLAFGAAMKEVGVRNEVAATGFEALLNVMKLGEEFSKTAGEGLKGLGINSTKMRKQFVAKPVETILMLLNKIKDVADPLKRAEIMTNLFGKEYQDDIAKMLNALPQLSKYLDLMGDKAKIASGGVRFQFAQNIDKDVSKIDMATQAIDVLYKRLGDPIKVQLGGVAGEISRWVEMLEQGDTVAQRLIERLKGGNKDDKKEEPSFDPLGYGATEILKRIDPKFGKTRDEQAAMDRAAEAARKEAERRQLLGRPADLQEQIQRREAVLDRSREVARGKPGIQRDMARSQVAKSEAELGRLRGDLERAWDAIGEMRAREKREKGAFGLGGATGKDVDGLGPGRFGFGLHGTENYAPRKVPLPPRRPAEFDGALTAGLDEAQGKADKLNETTIAPKADASGIAPLGTAADETKGKLTALDAMSVSPTVDPASIRAANADVLTLLSNLARVGTAANAAQSAVASLANGARSAAASVGGAVTRTAAVTSAVQNSPKTA